MVFLLVCWCCVVFFFFKQKTAYEMRISDWSSDVCSSDLKLPHRKGGRVMKSAVIVFPGSNCDRDLAVAFSEISGRETHMVWHGDSDLPDGIDVIGVPGGFSYGDYLRSGAMAARSPIMRAVVKAAERGVTDRKSTRLNS